MYRMHSLSKRDYSVQTKLKGILRRWFVQTKCAFCIQNAHLMQTDHSELTELMEVLRGCWLAGWRAFCIYRMHTLCKRHNSVLKKLREILSGCWLAGWLLRILYIQNAHFMPTSPFRIHRTAGRGKLEGDGLGSERTITQFSILPDTQFLR